MAQTIHYLESISYFVPIAEIGIRTYCFVRFVQPFLISAIFSNGTSAPSGTELLFQKKKKGIYYVGAAYFLIMLLLYIMSLPLHVYMAYLIGILLLFLMFCWVDRRNYKQKAFLVIVFFSLNCFATVMAEVLYDNLYAFAANLDYVENHPNLSIPLYVGVCMFYLALEFAFTTIGAKQILRVYRNKHVDMASKELVMLALPSFMGVVGCEIMHYYRRFYIQETGNNKNTYDVRTLLFCTVSMITIIMVVVLYQNMKAKQEENLHTELLAAHTNSLHQHIEQVENLYQKIRGIRHDMANHLLTLERLYAGNKTEEAQAYSEDLKAELAQTTGEIKSGNPVTDVILQEFKRKAEKKEISFHSEFYYPSDSSLNVFDISIILNNALQNAIDYTKRQQNISILSYRRNHAFLIEVRNSFAGSLQWNMESGLPVTSKEKTDGHGYGLSNIRRVARKYAGDLDIMVKDEEFYLCIMLITE